MGTVRQAPLVIGLIAGLVAFSAASLATVLGGKRWRPGLALGVGLSVGFMNWLVNWAALRRQAARAEDGAR